MLCHSWHNSSRSDLCACCCSACGQQRAAIYESPGCSLLPTVCLSAIMLTRCVGKGTYGHLGTCRRLEVTPDLTSRGSCAVLVSIAQCLEGSGPTGENSSRSSSIHATVGAAGDGGGRPTGQHCTTPGVCAGGPLTGQDGHCAVAQCMYRMSWCVVARPVQDCTPVA